MSKIFFIKCSTVQCLLIAAKDIEMAKKEAIRYLNINKDEVDFIVYPTGGIYRSRNDEKPIVLIDSSIL